MARNVQQKAVIRLPAEFKGLRPVERLAVGRKVLEFIRERTDEGKDKDNRAFKSVRSRKDRPLKGKYTAAYANSLDFKNAGKSTSPINLGLSGDMMASIKVLNFSGSGEITIGLDAGDEDNPKLEGNRKGTYGNSRQVAPKRDPLGITQEDLRKIIKTVDIRGAKTNAAIEKVREELAAALIPVERAIQRGKALPDITTRLDLSETRKLRRDIDRLEREIAEEQSG